MLEHAGNPGAEYSVWGAPQGIFTTASAGLMQWRVGFISSATGLSNLLSERGHNLSGWGMMEKDAVSIYTDTRLQFCKQYLLRTFAVLPFKRIKSQIIWSH